MRALIVDLNNFSRYPTIAVGLLTAGLRAKGHTVQVFSPLSVGAGGVAREPTPRPWGAWEARIGHYSASSRSAAARRIRSILAARRQPMVGEMKMRVISGLSGELALRPDVVLVSTYLMYSELCGSIVELCRNHGVPVLLGGSAFTQPEIVRAWGHLGADGIVGGEVEPFLPELALAAAEGRSLQEFTGVTPRGQQPSLPARPLRELDSIPFPDYSDFPWQAYPHRIAPILTGRGCGWGACSFCSDVTSSMGRTFRSRSSLNVLDELEFQSNANDARLFVFTDLKLNSDDEMWETLTRKLRNHVEGARWIGAVHAGRESTNQLSREAFRAARDSGMVRVTTGLESGSQRLLDSYSKGTDLADVSRFLKNAAQNDISVRATLIVGAPGEEPEDISKSAQFLEKHSTSIERVTLNRYQLMMGTPAHRAWKKSPDAFPGAWSEDPILGQLIYHPDQRLTRPTRKALGRLFNAAHQINRRPLRSGAAKFEGVM